MLDPRIARVLQLIEQLPLDQAIPARLAAQLHLSESRLGHLFKDETGCSLSEFMRWAAVWRAASLWKQGRPLTELAHAVGFFDLAHADRAFSEVFGLNPSTFVDPRYVTLIRYD